MLTMNICWHNRYILWKKYPLDLVLNSYGRSLDFSCYLSDFTNKERNVTPFLLEYFWWGIPPWYGQTISTTCTRSTPFLWRGPFFLPHLMVDLLLPQDCTTALRRRGANFTSTEDLIEQVNDLMFGRKNVWLGIFQSRSNWMHSTNSE